MISMLTLQHTALSDVRNTVKTELFNLDLIEYFPLPLNIEAEIVV